LENEKRSSAQIRRATISPLIHKMSNKMNIITCSSSTRLTIDLLQSIISFKSTIEINQAEIIVDDTVSTIQDLILLLILLINQLQNYNKKYDIDLLKPEYIVGIINNTIIKGEWRRERSGQKEAKDGWSEG